MQLIVEIDSFAIFHAKEKSVLQKDLEMKLHVATALAAVCLVAGCASTEQDRRAGTGALIGAGVGALAGQALGGNTASTLVGAAAGGIAGAAIGTATTPAGQRNGDLCRYRDQYGREYRAPCR